MKRDRDSKRPFGQRVGAAKAANPDTMSPIFSFEKMVDGNGYCVNSCDQENQAAVARRLFMLSKMSWRDIQNSPRHGIGTEKIARSALRPAIPNGISDDVTFLALRYNGRRPIVGYRDGRTFHLLFIDHNFSAYDHR